LGAFHPAHTNEDPCLLDGKVMKRGEVFRGAKIAEREFSPPLTQLHPPPHHHLPRIQALREFLPPPHRSSGAPKPPPLPSWLSPFIVVTVGLPPHHILRQGDPPSGHCAHTQDPAQEHVYVKEVEIDITSRNELEPTHPRVDDSVP
jgi:hypothetical protein